MLRELSSCWNASNHNQSAGIVWSFIFLKNVSFHKHLNLRLMLWNTVQILLYNKYFNQTMKKTLKSEIIWKDYYDLMA